MSKSAVPARRIFLYAVMIILLICTVVGVAAWTATSYPVFGLNNPVAPLPTHASPFSFIQIAKPAIIPAPVLQPETAPESAVIARIVSAAPSVDSAPIEPAAPSYDGDKYILVDISEQHMYVYEGDTVVYSFVSSTGMNNATRVGMFSVLDKIPSAYGGTWNIWMPNWLGIYYAGSLENGIHALPILSNGATLWEGYLGVPISYGCVVLGTYESQLLYDWAEIGTPVEIRW